MKLMETWKPLTIYFLAGISTFSLISISFTLRSLIPLAEWAELQNECIKRTVAYEGLSSKVWSCNGGGD